MSHQREMSKAITPNVPLWSYQLHRDSKMVVRSRKEFEIQLITRASQDEVFKQELLANPKEAIGRVFETQLPECISISVLEETETNLYMVLPGNPYDTVSEAELEASYGLTYEGVARWALNQQGNTLLDETASISMITRAWRDAGFKQMLLQNPVEIIEQQLNGKLPEGTNIQVIAETASDLCIVLPSGVIGDMPLDIDVICTDMSAMLGEVNMAIIAGSVTCGVTICIITCLIFTN